MVKKTIALALAVLFGANIMAQSIQETTLSVNGLTVPGYTMTVDKDIKMVQNAVEQRFKDAKLKTKNTEGYIAVLEQVIPEIASAPVNFYAKVVEVGKKKDKHIEVQMCAVCTDLTIDQSMVRGNVRNYLAAFSNYMGKYEAGLNMQAEQKNLKKAEKAAAAAASELSGLEKDIASDQKKIEDKKAEIVKLKEKIKDCEEDIKKLEQNIQKNTSKKADAENKVNDANQNVNAVQGEVERYRQMSE